MPSGSAVPAAGHRGLLRALAHANYRRFFLGQGVSLLGTWMQQTALAWLVLRLTDDAFLMGLNTFAGQIPSLLLLPVAGVLLDRWNRLRLVIVTQTLAMLQAFLLAALVLLDRIEIWQLMLLALSLGCINAFDLPARQAMLPELLDAKGDLSNAIALNSSLFNAARLVGPALAGVVVELGDAGNGEGWCFLVNGISFFGVLVALAFVKLRTAAPAAAPVPWLAALREGLAYAREHRPIRTVLLLVAAVGFLGMPYTVLVTLFAKDVLHGGPRAYGFLVTASGLGALIGAVYLATRSTVRGSPRRIVLTGLVAAAGLAGFAYSDDFALSLALMLLVGMNMMLTVVSCNTIVQTLVPDDKRGRIMSLYSLAFLGLTPFGNLIVGAVSKTWGPTAGMLCCATGCLAGAAVFAAGLQAVRAGIRAHLADQKAASPMASPPVLPGEVAAPAVSGEV